MSSELRLRRGTTAQHAAFTGAASEVTIDTDKKTLVVHDGSTAGGFPADFSGTPTERGFWKDMGSGADIRRLRDRVFIGDAADSTGNYNGTQGSWLPDAAAGANWALRDGQLVSMASTGLIGIVGASRSSDQNATPTECIGVAGFVIVDKAGSTGRPLYGDVQREAGTNYAYGLEVAVKNKGANETTTPYFLTTGTYGAYLVAGGDSTYGGSPANPSNTAVLIHKGASTWNRGIVFGANSLTGANGTTGTGVAIEMAKGHLVQWRAPDNTIGSYIYSSVTAGASGVFQIFSNNALNFNGANSTPILQLAHQANAENYFQIINRAAGSMPTMLAAGSDADIDISLQPKGAGLLDYIKSSTVAANSANFTADRYIPIKANGTTVYIPCRTSTW